MSSAVETPAVNNNAALAEISDFLSIFSSVCFFLFKGVSRLWFARYL
jgi:hypothetical protein